MRIVCLTDLHGDPAALDRILVDAGPADVVLLGGDITNFGTPNAAEFLVQRAQQHCPHVGAVAGNCDSQAIDERLAALGVSLSGRGVRHGQAGLYGASGMPPWTGTMYELSEDEIARTLWAGRGQLTPPAWEIVLCHVPPRGTRLDRTCRGEHVGSHAVRQFVEQAQPALLLCGHIHESRGTDRLGDTILVNCGRAFAGQYAVAELDSQVRVELREARLAKTTPGSGGG
ncbi:MAG: YfcE family phosphodiesterase [Candidatus Anammoximicrobium sp.]|nr:YfcE family phosphodiesterase [Candidatus Anammoximicrobium sp.]